MAATKRLMKEFKAIGAAMPKGVDSLKPDDSNVLLWAGTLQLPFEPYVGGTFKFKFEFPAEYPFKAPVFTFVTPIYHPNVDAKGAICMRELAPDTWKPATKVAQVLDALVKLLETPECSHPLRAELAEEYTTDKAKYMDNARKETAKAIA